jgi:hypothetical protein
MTTHIHCGTASHWHRRTLLQTVAGIPFFGSLADVLASEATSAKTDSARPKSVILLWLEGGPSQLETFDPHPGGRIGGRVRKIQTSAPGIEIADTLPQLAAQMHHGSLLRSVVGKEGDHDRAIYNIKTGYRPDPTLIHPAIGSILCSQSDLGADIPRHVSILPGSRPSRGGYLGAQYDAFKVYDPANPVPDVQRRVDKDRYDRRIEDLLEIAEMRFTRRRLVDLDRRKTLHAAMTQSALTMMTSDQLEAFDVSQEPKSTRDQFGDTPFGRGCLAAVRLIDVGVRCVEVTLGGWDTHINNHSLQSGVCSTLDPAAAAMIAELESRDLLETTLVVIAGEFGRTPRINPAEGRDHWVHGFSMMLAGCGIRQGGVYGATAADDDFNPEKPADGVRDPISVADVHATMLAALGVNHRLELQTPIGRPMLLSDGNPIAALLKHG